MRKCKKCNITVTEDNSYSSVNKHNNKRYSYAECRKCQIERANLNRLIRNKKTRSLYCKKCNVRFTKENMKFIERKYTVKDGADRIYKHLSTVCSICAKDKQKMHNKIRRDRLSKISKMLIKKVKIAKAIKPEKKVVKPNLETKKVKVKIKDIEIVPYVKEKRNEIKKKESKAKKQMIEYFEANKDIVKVVENKSDTDKMVIEYLKKNKIKKVK